MIKVSSVLLDSRIWRSPKSQNGQRQIAPYIKLVPLQQHHSKMNCIEDIYDVFIIGAGSCGLECAARLREHTPAAIFANI